MEANTFIPTNHIEIFYVSGAPSIGPSTRTSHRRRSRRQRIGARLVEHEQFRVGRERAGQQHTLLLASRRVWKVEAGTGLASDGA